MLPANIPMTIGCGSQRMTCAPAPANPSATSATPAARQAPASSAALNCPPTAPSSTSPGIVQVIGIGWR